MLKKSLAIFLCAAMTLGAAPKIVFTASAVAPEIMVAAVDETIEANINKTLSELSLEERVSLMSGGGASVGAGATKELTGLVRMNMSDGPMGISANGPATSFASGLIMSSTWDPKYAYEVGEIIGKEAKDKNVQIALGPGMNIIRDLAGGRTFEYYSEDPLLAGKVTAAYSSGVQSQEVSATLKHLFANNQEENRNWSSMNLSERAIHEIYLPPFKEAIEEGDTWSLMTGANRVNGVFTSDNRYILTNMSKYDYGLKGVIMTDWCSVRSNAISARAGLDVAMPGAGPYSGLLNAVRSGFVSGEVIDASAQRVARLAYLTKSTTNMEGYTPAQRLPGANHDNQDHRDKTVEVNEEGQILLKNDGILPLTKANPKIALIGKYVHNNPEGGGLGGSSNVTPPYTIKHDEAIKEVYKGTDATFVTPSYNENSEAELVASINASVAAAKESDYVIIYAGINKSGPEHSWGHAPDTEGNDRLDLDFPEAQLRLINAVSEVAGTKTVVVLNGSVFEIRDWVDDVNAVLTAFHPGQGGSTATAGILTGLVNPSGKLTFTWPKRYKETIGYIPGYNDQHDAKQEDVDYSEGIFEGYRYYDQKNLTPEFAFGHGLSYSTYNWSDITLDKTSMGPEDTITASVTLTNTNNLAGKQVVQLYINDPESSVIRPVKELKGFEKQMVNANGSTTFTFEITKDQLSFWDVNSHSMLAEAGLFNILMGDSSDHILAEASFTLTSNSAPDPDYTVAQAENYIDQKDTTIGDVVEVDSEIMDYADNKYIIMGGNGSFASWNVNVAQAGKYSIIFRYSNDAFGGKVEGYTEQYNMPTELVVNGIPHGYYDFQNTRNENIWNYDSIDVLLESGQNTIKLNGTDTSSGLKVDKLITQKINQWWADPVPAVDSGGVIIDPDATVFEAETATMLNNASIEDNAQGYSGEGYVQLSGTGSAVALPIYAPTSVLFRLQVTYSNGSGSPAPSDLYVNGIKRATYTFGPTEGDSDWKFEQTVEIGLLTGINTIMIESQIGSVNIDKITVLGGMGYIDSQAPIINGTSPSNSGTLINDISVYFSETVILGEGNVSISDGVNSFVPEFVLDGAVLKISPDWSALKTGTTYTVTVDTDTIKDTSGNALAKPYEFTFVVPAANYNDPTILYAGEWTDTGTVKSAGVGASLDFWYYGDQCVLRGIDGNAVVNVWIDDYLDPKTITLSGDGDQVVSLFDTKAQENGIHNIKIEVVSGTFEFVGAIANKSLIDQPLSKSGWTAIGVRDSTSDPFALGIDGDRSTRWTSAATQDGNRGDWYGINFGKDTDINTLLFVCRQSNVGSEIRDYTRGYELFVSDDGVNWTGPLASGAGSPMFTDMVFPTRTTKFVKVVQTGNASDWWSIYEAYGFRIPEELTPTVGLPKAPKDLTATGFNEQIKLAWSASAKAISYEISRDGEVIGKTNTTSYVDILGANDGQTYTYTVKAVDVMDNTSLASTEVTATADPQILSVPRNGWDASASVSHVEGPPSMAIDDDLTSRWITGNSMQPGMWFEVDMGAIHKFNNLTILSNTTDYPRSYEIVTSNDGSNWSTPIASGAGEPNAMNIILPEAAEARFVRIRLTASDGSWWTIFDFNVALLGELKSPQNVTTVGYNGFIRVDWFAPLEEYFVADHYDVYRNGVLIQGDLTNTRYVDTNVQPDKLYTYEIVAIAANGDNSPKSIFSDAICDVSKTELPKGNWSAAASVSHGEYPPSNVYDSIDVTTQRTKWHSGAAQDGTQTFTLYLNDVYPVDMLRISSDATDYGRMYDVKAFVNNEWILVASDVAGKAGNHDITFDKVYASAFEIHETAVGTQAWAIFELYAFNTGVETPILDWSIENVNVSSTHTIVSITRGANPETATISVASYTEDGKLLNVESLPAANNDIYHFSKPSEDASEIKVFLWDDSYAPLTEAWTTELPN